jgi:hypothetical protein
MFGVPDRPAAEQPAEATVGALLEETRWMHDEERRYGQALDTRLTVSAGFVGLILALVVGGYFGASGVQGSVAIFVDILYVVYVVLLTTSILIAVSPWARSMIAKLRGEEDAAPWCRVGIDDEALDGFSGALAAEPAVQVEQRMIATLVEAIKDERSLNGARWKALRLGVLGLAAALAALATQGIVLLFAV